MILAQKHDQPQIRKEQFNEILNPYSSYTSLSIKNQIAPPTINLDSQDPECDLDYIPNVAREIKINMALSNSFGFGGTNGTLVFKRFE